MLIAVAASGAGEQAQVPESYEESTALYIVETDDGSVVASYGEPGEGGLSFAERVLEHDCEAVACGRFLTPAAFERLATSSVSRYYAAGLPVREAAQAADRGLLPLLTDHEGGVGCGRHDRDRCAEDRARAE